MKKTTIAFAALLALNTVNADAKKSGYHVAANYSVSGNGGWDYITVDPVGNGLYVSHGTQVNILNKQTGDSIGMIPNTMGVHGIALVQDLKKGYTSNGQLNTVSVFDLNSFKVTGAIKTGEKPDAIMYDAFSKKVYVCNGRSNDLTVIDPATNTVVTTVALGGKPETAVSDGAGKLYINIEDKSEIVVVNTATYEVEKRWTIGSVKEPSGLAIDNKTHRLFAGCDNKVLIVLDATNGKVVKELPIGEGCDGVVFDPGTHCIFSANGESGTVTIIDEEQANKYTVLENLPTRKTARTICVDESTHKVYMPSGEYLPREAGAKGKPGVVPGSFKVLVLEK